MAKTQSTFPTTIDATLQTDRASGDIITSESYDVLEDAVFELETKVGVNSSAVTGSIDYKISNYPTAGVKSRIIQVVNVMATAVATGSTVMVWDDTIPQNTEGTEFLSAAITPTNASNKLLIEVVLNVSHTADGHLIAALFQDSTANALACVDTHCDSTQVPMNLTLHYYMAAGTTSSTTFKVRAGNASAGTMTLNGSGGNRYFGGVFTSSITITEIGV